MLAMRDFYHRMRSTEKNSSVTTTSVSRCAGLYTYLRPHYGNISSLRPKFAFALFTLSDSCPLVSASRLLATSVPFHMRVLKLQDWDVIAA
jgi:hypothetical protein